jgi:hypothetical protein
MNLKGALDYYNYHSGKTSDLVRQLGLAGIAVVWIFKVDVHGVPKIPAPLLMPLVLIVCGLAFDLLQYAVATSIWGIFHRLKERKGVDSPQEFFAPPYINWPALAFFWLKVISIIAAYYFLLAHLARTLLPQ